MSNQKRLEKYLIGEDGYLRKEISNGKVIMLSGKWGSGKTHFWKNIIEKELIENQTKKQKAYVYSSLYGNRTLDKIEDNIYAQAYLCSVGGKNAVLSGYEKLKDFGKRFGSFCSLLDVSKLVDGIDDIQQKNIKKSALSYLENGGIVCFDDFERKSKDIDLNDLFGFISHLAIDLNCKVVIILNDDVFEGEEKKIFSNVKEKSVSKFLKYEPSIKEIFETIFSDKKYRVLDEHKEIILNTIEETEELNARIYIQVLDNLVEWIEKNQDKSDKVLKYLIFVNINFILNHHIFKLKFHKIQGGEGNCISSDSIYVKEKESLPKDLMEFMNGENYNKEFIDKLKVKVNNDFNEIKKIDKAALLEYINNNQSLVNSLHFIKSLKMYELFNPYEQIKLEPLHKINNFIETGILINE